MTVRSDEERMQSPGESQCPQELQHEKESGEESESESEEEERPSSGVKKKNMDPGRRVIGGRIYDSVLGKTCHWCRQKTMDDRVHCAAEGCGYKFCCKCLLNRHGELIQEQMMDGVRWICPKCRGGCGPGCETNCCNCGPCRRAQGLGATGQMIQRARVEGFNNVHDYLIHLKTGERPEAIATRKLGRDWLNEQGILAADALAPTPLKRLRSHLDDASTPLSKKMRGSLTPGKHSAHKSRTLKKRNPCEKPEPSDCPSPVVDAAMVKLEHRQFADNLATLLEHIKASPLAHLIKLETGESPGIEPGKPLPETREIQENSSDLGEKLGTPPESREQADSGGSIRTCQPPTRRHFERAKKKLKMSPAGSLQEVSKTPEELKSSNTRTQRKVRDEAKRLDLARKMLSTLKRRLARRALRSRDEWESDSESEEEVEFEDEGDEPEDEGDVGGAAEDDGSRYAHLLNEGEIHEDDELPELRKQARRALNRCPEFRAAVRKQRRNHSSYAHLVVAAPRVKQEVLPSFDSDNEEDSGRNSSLTEQQDSDSESGSDLGIGTGKSPELKYSEQLAMELEKPFDARQLRNMMQEASKRKGIVRHRETRNRTVCVETSCVGASYLDQYPDLAAKVSAANEEEQLRLLRGFFFWLQHVCNPGAFKPWACEDSSKDTDDCCEIRASDCEITAVVVSLTEKRTAKTLCEFSPGKVKLEVEG